MSEESFFGYKDIGEKGFIEWSLQYTFDPIVECFEVIPEKQRYERMHEKLNAPCHILGHIALNEEDVIKGVAHGISERRCPFPRHLFDPRKPPSGVELREGISDSSQLVEYWRAVRKGTLEYLRALDSADLSKPARKSTLPEGAANRDNPIREFFIMTIQNQNCHWGELRAICKMLDLPMQW